MDREAVKADLRLFCAKGLMTVLKIFRLVPLDQRRVLFSSYDGRQYSDSPKYVYLTYLEKEPERKKALFWAANGKETCKEMRRLGLNAVNTHSLRFYAVFSSCGKVVVNQHLPTYLPVRRGQTVVNTWHGSGPGKKVGMDAPGATLYDKKHYALQNRKYAAFVSGSAFNTRVTYRTSFGYRGPVLEYGLPRNSLLLGPHREAVEHVRRTFGVAEGTGIALYAPTFRGTGEAPVPEADLAGLRIALERRFGKPFVFLFRAHHAVSGPKGAPAGEQCLDASAYPDMQELLCASDVLLTDYSSSMTDMALLGRPVFLFVPDKDAYLRERGMYWPVEKLPFPQAADQAGLEQAVLSFGEEDYKARLKAYFDELGLREGPDSALRTYRWLESRPDPRRKR